MELVERKRLGYQAIAVTDRNTLAGIVLHTGSQRCPVAIYRSSRADFCRYRPALFGFQPQSVWSVMPIARWDVAEQRKMIPTYFDDLKEFGNEWIVDYYSRLECRVENLTSIIFDYMSTQN